jgi:hypothetical protein
VVGYGATDTPGRGDESSVRGQRADPGRFGWGIVAPCLLAALLIGLVVPFYTADDDGVDPGALPVAIVIDTRPADTGIPFLIEPAERAGAVSIVRREIERGPPRS